MDEGSHAGLFDFVLRPSVVLCDVAMSDVGPKNTYELFIVGFMYTIFPLFIAEVL